MTVYVNVLVYCFIRARVVLISIKKITIVMLEFCIQNAEVDFGLK